MHFQQIIIFPFLLFEKMPKRKAINIRRSETMLAGEKRKEEAKKSQEERVEKEEIEVSSEASFEINYDDNGTQNDTLASNTRKNISDYVPYHLIENPTDVYLGVIEYDTITKSTDLVRFDGNRDNLFEICGVSYGVGGIKEQLIVGTTTIEYKRWAQNNYNAALKFVQCPTLQRGACRAVIMALEQKMTILDDAFGFGLLVRTKVLAEKVKGFVRKATGSIYKAQTCDDVHALDDMTEFINWKLLERYQNAIKEL